MTTECGLVLAGAVAKGGFHAGALQAIAAQERVQVTRVVGASAGALCAAVYGAGVAVGDPKTAAQVTERLWRKDGGLFGFLRPDPLGFIRGQGLSNTRRVHHLVKTAIDEVMGPPGRFTDDQLREVGVGLVVTDVLGRSPDGCASDLSGPTRRIAAERGASERLLCFTAKDYNDDAQRDRISQAAAASATFPFLFTPTTIDGHLYIDGGAVNNAPLSYIFEGATARRPIVITAEPALVKPPRNVGGTWLLSHMVAILLNERLVRDLERADKVNDKMRRLQDVLQRLDIAPHVRQEIVEALGWSTIEHPVVIRPREELPGGAFQGFFSAKLRRDYIHAGSECAQAAMTELGGKGARRSAPIADGADKRRASTLVAPPAG